MKKLTAGKVLLRILLILFTTLALLLAAAAGAVWVVLRGPSPAARDMLTRSMKETSAIGFIPDLFLPEEQVAEIMSYKEEVPETEQVDTSLVTISATRRETVAQQSQEGGQSAAPGGTDNGDGIEFIGVTGANYRGIMMVVEDPFRLFVGTPDRYGSGVGLTLEQMIEKYDALAGINGGGFYDPGGGGSGDTPDGIVIANGELMWGAEATSSTVIGFDADGILHVGWMSAAEALERNIQWACSFGPALIVNGEAQTGSVITTSGMNPRTAIGQRDDGAVLLLVVDGRQITSLGATYEDLISIMLAHGAVNAANLDGGSSSQMIYQGEAKNINASVIGTRPLPTAFLVRK
ncbi:MAG: phosphodiester glycosidase family protein [Oscillospiraceae bacterium]|nr:phosphodiester glycosidase family protein [Oscillospiraceae bacterium]